MLTIWSRGAGSPSAGVVGSTTGPVIGSERIESIDVLRGFALLGILVMNIQGFSMIGAAYLNPAAYGDLSAANWWVWALSHLFADQKFMTLFSVLFGAGIVMIWERAEAAGRMSVGLHYRRTLWLLVFGLAHAYLLWSGDILFLYAICALWIYWIRKASPKVLTVIGSIVLMVPPVLYLAGAFTMPSWPTEMLTELAESWAPGHEAITREVQNFQGSWAQQMESRVQLAVGLQLEALPFWGFWRASGLMLIGMALFKVGFLQAELTDGLYRRFFLGGLVFGLPIIAFGIQQNFVADWDVSRFFLGSLYNYFGSLPVSLAYVSAIMLMHRRRTLVFLQRSLAAVGRMALTNYLAQTIICTTIFYGHGLGYFGQVDRVGQIMIVFSVWVFQIPFSVWWLGRFRFGPFEWVWRSLSYLEVQPMRIR